MNLSLNQLAILTIIAALPLLLLPELPSRSTILALTAFAIVCAVVPLRNITLLALVVLMLCWMLWSARGALWQVENYSQNILPARVVVDRVTPDGKRAQVRLLTVHERWVFPPVHASVALPKQGHVYCAGQRWQMRLKLRPVHSQLNEGHFDQQRYALANHHALQGHVMSASMIDENCSIRSQFLTNTQSVYQHLPWSGVLTALAFGERGELSAELSKLFRETGTAHLMAISGMHIGLAAGFGWILARGLQFLLPAKWIGHLFPLAITLLVAGLYTWLSGAHPPAQRAMLALLLWTAIRVSGKNWHGWHIWNLCIAALLLLDPLMILSESFWLSAFAVAALIAWYQWFPLPESLSQGIKSYPLKLLHLQAGMMILMLPVQAWVFSGLSLSALPANLMAIPVISLLTVPLILLALALPFSPIEEMLWWLADRSVAAVILCLRAFPSGWLAIEDALLMLICLPLAALIVWRFGWWRHAPLSLAGCCCALAIWRLTIPKPEWRVDMLDVGHGLAIVISKQGKAILYDTGNRWLTSNAGERIIIPWLERKGLQPEWIILSHGHLDHTGGLQAIQQRWPDISVRSALAHDRHFPCHAGESWQWYQLNFSVLWPRTSSTSGGNNDSCVVRIDDGRTAILLTGDIEREAELALLAAHRHQLRADILQVPHHGSSTSSVAPLLRAVAGKAALTSVARYNAWRMPSRQVIERYQQNGYAAYDTATEGQISVQITSNGWQVLGFRPHLLPRWYHQWFGVPRDSR